MPQYTSSEGATGQSIWIMNCDGNERKLVADNYAWGARWTSDGCSLVYRGGKDRLGNYSIQYVPMPQEGFQPYKNRMIDLHVSNRFVLITGPGNGNAHPQMLSINGPAEPYFFPNLPKNLKAMDPVISPDNRHLIVTVASGAK